MMNVSAVAVDPRHLRVLWDDGSVSRHAFLWLRDNCSSAFHPQTNERVFDLLSVPDDLHPRSVRLEDGEVVIAWAEDGAVSHFPCDWLASYREGEPVPDLADVPPVLWDAGFAASIERHDATSIMNDDAALARWMWATRRDGISLVTRLADDLDAGIRLSHRVGFNRETNFGVVFDVVSKPDPNNLAYTPIELPLHTDLPNQEIPPGYQFLHCLANEAEGGGSRFADGFRIVEDLHRDEPEAFRILAHTPVPLRFRDRKFDIRVRRPVIETDFDGRVRELRYSAHMAGTFDLPPELMDDYYRAWRSLMRRVRDPHYGISLRLRSGEMVVFDNRRILHGREAFDPNSGRRHLRGCYVDRSEFDSRLRVLMRGG